MTEFKLTNGKTIELTTDGYFIRGNRIESDGNVNIDDEPKIMEPDPISYGRLAALEAKLSTAITEINNLKITIKAERSLTDNKITDAIIKWTVNGK